MIELSSEGASHEYRTIYYLALTYNSLTQVCSPRVLKQKVIVNGQVFELSEAYGINSGNQECIICFDQAKATIAKPCKHVSMCAACAAVVFNGDRKCPVCREQISEVIPFQIV
jgi:hypothetical protein